MVCTSPPPVAPLCADNHTCDSSDSSHLTFVYPYIVILLLAAILLSAITIISVIVWKRKRDRTPNNGGKCSFRKGMFRVDSQTCSTKITNIKASQGVRPSSYNNGHDALYNTLSLNNLENSRNCGLEENESVSCDYLQNINPTNKIRNVENADAVESPKGYEMASYGFPQPAETHVISRIDDH